MGPNTTLWQKWTAEDKPEQGEDRIIIVLTFVIFIHFFSVPNSWHHWLTTKFALLERFIVIYFAIKGIYVWGIKRWGEIVINLRNKTNNNGNDEKRFYPYLILLTYWIVIIVGTWSVMSILEGVFF